MHVDETRHQRVALEIKNIYPEWSLDAVLRSYRRYASVFYHDHVVFNEITVGDVQQLSTFDHHRLAYGVSRKDGQSDKKAGRGCGGYPRWEMVSPRGKVSPRHRVSHSDLHKDVHDAMPCLPTSSESIASVARIDRKYPSARGSCQAPGGWLTTLIQWAGLRSCVSFEMRLRSADVEEAFKGQAPKRLIEIVPERGSI